MIDDSIEKEVSSHRGEDNHLNQSKRKHDESVILEKTLLQNKTILDYRDFLEVSMERSNSITVMKSSFLKEQDAQDLTEKEVEEMLHHGHSDFESENDPDPYFEYNGCNNVSKLDLKIDGKKTKFQQIEISGFYTRPKLESPIDVNIQE